MKTLYDKYLKIETLNDDIAILKFILKNSIRYSKCKITKAKDGVYITDKYSKVYAEITYNSYFIDDSYINIYYVENNKIGEWKNLLM